MNKNETKTALELLEKKGMAHLIQEAIKEKYDCPFPFEIKTNDESWVRIDEKKCCDGYETTHRVVRGNELLKDLFKEMSLYATIYYREDDPVHLYADIAVSYTHPQGGSNGHSLSLLKINVNSKVALFK